MALKAPTRPWAKFIATRIEASRFEKTSAFAGVPKRERCPSRSGNTRSSAAP